MYAVYFASAGSFLPMILMNGMFWPLEGMPKVLYWISCLSPTTFPCISVRGIIFKGSSISDSEVYIGVLISLGWIMLFFVVTLLDTRYPGGLPGYRRVAVHFGKHHVYQIK
ncbi:PREDICTED: uncharacterized protein LOC105570913 [Vollenhovia emeryi]|uniref:uncharacterized protein LOC105570913 n=1 Tax=Vollenhovia emeryi TaxID=411798 RepID=UPI0005F3A071|nr:PREDICTED: uncharacterized protein LOC105570913 [Vollenhovia emeryi]